MINVDGGNEPELLFTELQGGIDMADVILQEQKAKEVDLIVIDALNLPNLSGMKDRYSS